MYSSNQNEDKKLRQTYPFPLKKVIWGPVGFLSTSTNLIQVLSRYSFTAALTAFFPEYPILQEFEIESMLYIHRKQINFLIIKSMNFPGLIITI